MTPLLLSLILLQPAVADDEVEEIVVWDENRVEAARQQVIDAFEQAGWAVHKERDDGSIIFRHHRDRWKGSFVLGEQGSIRTRRPLAYDWRIGFPFPHPTRFLPSKAKLKGPRRRALTAIRDDLDGLHEAQARMAAEARWEHTVAKLDALWERGEPLDDGPILKEPADRRQAVLDLWATRTETEMGRLTMSRIADWLQGTVQASDHPLTDAEIAQAEARRHDGARLFDPPEASP